MLRALDDLDFAHLRLDVAGAEAAVDDAEPPSSAWTMAIGARVTVSMLAETIGRFSVRCCETRHDRSIAAGSRRDDDAALRRQQEIVERAAAHQLGDGLRAAAARCAENPALAIPAILTRLARTRIIEG